MRYLTHNHFYSIDWRQFFVLLAVAMKLWCQHVCPLFSASFFFTFHSSERILLLIVISTSDGEFHLLYNKLPTSVKTRPLECILCQNSCDWTHAEITTDLGWEIHPQETIVTALILASVRSLFLAADMIIVLQHHGIILCCSLLNALGFKLSAGSLVVMSAFGTQSVQEVGRGRFPRLPGAICKVDEGNQALRWRKCVCESTFWMRCFNFPEAKLFFLWLAPISSRREVVQPWPFSNDRPWTEGRKSFEVDYPPSRYTFHRWAEQLRRHWT